MRALATILGNQPLRSAIARSIRTGLRSPSTILVPGHTSSAILERSLNSAVRDINNDPRGRLFQRLLLYGPAHGLPVQKSVSGLSDAECAACVEFIYSHMVNRFQGEMAELLAIGPVVKLVERLRREGLLPRKTTLYWGEMVWEPPLSWLRRKPHSAECPFTKGADGLLVVRNRDTVVVLGAIEVKSMRVPRPKVLRQVAQHFERLEVGVRLGDEAWFGQQVRLVTRTSFELPLRILVMPGRWKLSREWAVTENERGCRLLFSPPRRPSVLTSTRQMEAGLWDVTLNWSVEALAQAAYEMTFWYMSEVGKQVFDSSTLPPAWSYMEPDEAGRNSIKQMLYLMLNTCQVHRQVRLATRLYNVYAFGFPSAADNDQLLAPEDFSQGSDQPDQ